MERINFKVIAVVLTGVIVFWAKASFAVDYHVHNNSNNTLGNKKNSYTEIQDAVNKLKAGDSLYVYKGTYAGFKVSTSGSKSEPILIEAVGEVIINKGYNDYRDNIEIDNSNYITLSGFIVRNAKRAGIAVIESDFVSIIGNKAEHNYKWGIFSAFSNSIIIKNNITSNTTKEHGIYVSNSRTDKDFPVIVNNTSFLNNYSGLQLNGDCHMEGDGMIDGARIEKNIIFKNNYKGMSLISIKDSIVQNNVLYENGIRGGAAAIHLTDEPGCKNPSTNNVIVNNTIIEPRIAGIRITDEANSNIIFNNIVMGKKRIKDEVSSNFIDDKSNLVSRIDESIFFDSKNGDYRIKKLKRKGVQIYMKMNAPKLDFSDAVRATPTIGAYTY